jgi:HEPN domain-containing protein
MPPDEFMDDARQWLRYAEADLALAGVPLPEKGMYEQLSFHAQQAVEKALKAILISNGIDFPKTHSIEYLLRLLPSNVTRAPVLMQVYKLTGYATIFRYPGNEEQQTCEAYQELLSIARDTLAWAVIVINGLEA